VRSVALHASSNDLVAHSNPYGSANCVSNGSSDRVTFGDPHRLPNSRSECKPNKRAHGLAYCVPNGTNGSAQCVTNDCSDGGTFAATHGKPNGNAHCQPNRSTDRNANGKPICIAQRRANSSAFCVSNDVALCVALCGSVCCT